MNYVTLNNGKKMPVLGLGTYLLSPDEAEASVCFALQNGYELIDTANAYENEKAVGRGIRRSGTPREKVFLETKLWPCFYEDASAIDKTLKRLDTDYIDLMILHQPVGNYISGYHLLEEAYKEEKLKAIGISNFTIPEIEDLLAHCEIAPMLIQVEAHPYYPQTELKAFLKKYGTVLQAWYPLGGRGNGSILNDPVVAKLAEKYGKSPAQIILRWAVQMDHIVIPGSKTESHILDNLSVFDFELTPEDMAEMAGLARPQPFFIPQPGMMEHFAAWVPNVDNQK